ncbi:MAG: type I 3-dehydroquinate dehydratase [Desulfurococcales archaeon]
MRIRRPLIVASLPIRTTADLDLINDVKEADFIELRLDYMENPASLDLEKLIKYRSKIIVTIREVSEGGVRAVDALWKSMYLKKLYDLGIMYDVEASYLQRYQVPYEGMIVSVHYINSLPSREEIIETITRYADKVYSVKIAVKAFKGYRTLLSSLLDIGYENLTFMPIATDPIERLAFSLLGSKLIYGYVSEPTAPGQLHYRDLIRIFNCISTSEDLSTG